MRKEHGLLHAVVGCLLLAVAPSQAQTGKPSAAAGGPLTSSKNQVAGISERVVDNLYRYTDKYFHDGDYNRIVSLCRIIVEADPSFTEAYENAAYLLWSQGDSAAADRFLEMGLKRSKNQLSLLYEFGSHLMRTKRHEAALPYLQKAVKLPKAGPLVYVELAHCYEKNNNLKQSVATWQEVVRKFPNFPSGPPNLARTKRQLASGG
ncbi:MAG: tetratricopeptide repeat protein [Capsulimonadales bacterium]|nr:tetratricopeptide repeat protein [Capsulimonadales bacterium]